MSDPCTRAALTECDPILADMIEREKSRQWQCLECIASENFTSRGTDLSARPS
jgi:glycine hydroxymethyltransferase